MSASLVGSEMCIRDSSRSAECAEQHTPVLRSVQSSTLPFRGACRTANSVSYTHLTLPTICSV
eukprot:8097636-Alexandrium_andersonii.AAC.1